MKQSSEIAQPSEQALDLPAAHVATQNTSVLGLWSRSVAPMRSDQLYAVLFELRIEFVAGVGFIADQSSRLLSKKRLLKGSLDKGDFMRRSTFCVNGDRKTIAVRHCHDLGPLATLGFANTRAPFFAAAKVASMKHSDRSSLPRLRRSSASASKTTRSVPVCTQAWKRLWHVWYGGYRSGRSAHGAPVRITQSTPLSTARVSQSCSQRVSIVANRTCLDDAVAFGVERYGADGRPVACVTGPARGVALTRLGVQGMPGRQNYVIVAFVTLSCGLTIYSTERGRNEAAR